MAGLTPVTCLAEEATTNSFALTMHSIIVPEIHIVPPELKCTYQYSADPFSLAAGGGVVGVADAASINQNSFAIHARNLTMLELVDMLCFLSDNTYTFGDGGLVIAPTNWPALQLKQNEMRERALIAKMKGMTVPESVFSPPATIIDALAYMYQVSADYDDTEIPAKQRGINFAVKNPQRMVVIKKSESNVPRMCNLGRMSTLYDTLTNVCESVDARFMLHNNTVVIYPATETNARSMMNEQPKGKQDNAPP